jgi:hypothetical protein
MNRNSRMNLNTLTSILLCAALTACGGEEAGVPGPGPSIQVLPSTQSACKIDSKSDKGGYSLGAISATAQGDTVTILHEDARYNCASRLALEATVSGNQIVVQEKITNPGELAFCICDYDLSVQVKGLPAGTYTVSITDADGNPAGTAEVVVAGSAPLQTQSLQSACKVGSKGTFSAGNLTANVAGGTLTVLHEDASYNCFAKVALEATVSGGTILVKEVITNADEPMARCTCDFDLTAEVKGLSAGSYTLELRDADGKTVGSLQLTI